MPQFGQAEHLSIFRRVKVKFRCKHISGMNALKGGHLSIRDHATKIAVHILKSCSSPVYESENLHAGCVEIHVLEGARSQVHER